MLRPAFYRTPEEKKVIEDQIAQWTAAHKSAGKVVTQVVPFVTFYPAEDYHQEYISNHPENPYVEHISIPDYLRFRSTFKGNFK